MRGPLKQLASDTAVYGFSSIVARFFNYLLVPFYTHVFPPGEYGAVAKAYAAFVFLNVIYTYGMESAYLKHAAGKERPRLQTVFSTALWTLIGTSLVFSLLALQWIQPAAGLMGLEEDAHLLYYMAGILVCDTLLAVPMAQLRLQRKSWTFAGIRLAGVTINLGFNLWLILGSGWGVEAVLLGNLAGSAASLVLAWLPVADLFRATYDPGLVRSMLAFGLPYVPTGLGYAITEAIDRFFLDRMDPAVTEALYGADTQPGDVVGIYNACFKLGVFMLLYVQMFRFAWQPFFLNLQDDPEAPGIFSRAFTLFTAIGALVFLGVSFFARALVAIPVPGGEETRTLIEPSYWDGLFIVPLVLLAYLAQGWYTHFTAGIFIKSRTIHLPWITLAGAAVTLSINASLTPRYGMAASATATVLSHLAMAILVGAVAYYHFPIPYQWKRLTMITLVTGLAFAAHAALPETIMAYAGRAALLIVVSLIFVARGAIPLPSRYTNNHPNANPPGVS